MIEKAKTIQCQSNLRQIGLAIHLYASDHHDRLPSNSHQRGPDGSPLSWTHTLEAYLGPEFLGRCPSTPDHPARITYALNDLLAEPDGTGIPFLSVRDPSTTLTIAEIATHQFSEHFHFRGAARGRVSASFFRSLVNVTAHGDGANYLFVDGHVDTLPWPEIQQRLDQPNPVLLQP
jgi:prepilin-type processing-associated H-X9-DG protein